MNLRSVARVVKRKDIASLSLLDACKILSNMPEAKDYNVSVAMIYRAVHGALPPDQAEMLFKQAGIRSRICLADLAYFAQHDSILREVVAALIWLMDQQR